VSVADGRCSSPSHRSWAGKCSWRWTRPLLNVCFTYQCLLTVFTPKQVFGPRTAKSQPIWIKFCTHLFLYGIHSWADLDRDRRMGGFRPNQNDCVILITHPKSYIETMDRRDFGGKPWKWRPGRVLSWKIPDFCSVSKKQHFSRFMVSFDYPAHSLQKTVLPQTDGTGGKSRLKVCLLLWLGISEIWAPERCRKVVTWPSRKLKICIEAGTRRKIHWFPKCYSFRSPTKNNEVILENRFRTVASTGACERLAVLNWRSSSIHPSSL